LYSHGLTNKPQLLKWLFEKWLKSL
jgi:hypothetical protein